MCGASHCKLNTSRKGTVVQVISDFPGQTAILLKEFHRSLDLFDRAALFKEELESLTIASTEEKSKALESLAEALKAAEEQLCFFYKVENSPFRLLLSGLPPEVERTFIEVQEAWSARIMALAETAWWSTLVSLQQQKSIASGCPIPELEAMFQRLLEFVKTYNIGLSPEACQDAQAKAEAYLFWHHALESGALSKEALASNDSGGEFVARAARIVQQSVKLLPADSSCKRWLAEELGPALTGKAETALSGPVSKAQTGLKACAEFVTLGAQVAAEAGTSKVPESLRPKDQKFRREAVSICASADEWTSAAKEIEDGTPALSISHSTLAFSGMRASHIQRCTTSIHNVCTYSGEHLCGARIASSQWCKAHVQSMRCSGEGYSSRGSDVPAASHN